MHTMTAHQRRIREAMASAQPRTAAPTLQGYSVETISRLEAMPIILHYEWLRTLGRSTIFIGLLSPEREIHGVACFGYGPAGGIRNLIGTPALCLERGACVHWAPRNAASFLINAACKLVCRLTGTALFFAYADPMAGEYGGVYQAAGWAYLGQGIDGKRNRSQRYFVLPPGADWNNPADWKTTRALRRNGRRLKFSDLITVVDARSAQRHVHAWRLAQRAAKHVYATNVGRARQRWRASLTSAPYPAPCPELKRSGRSAPRSDTQAETRFAMPLLRRPRTDLFRNFSFEQAN